jgi:hypothetical protein
VADGHTGGDAVGVDDEVGDYSLGSEGQVLWFLGHTAGALLAVSGCEFISDLGHSYTAGADLNEFAVMCILRYNY